MTEQIEHQPPNLNKIEEVISLLQEAFPRLREVPLHSDILDSSQLQKLAQFIQLSIPIHGWPSELLGLYEKITSLYYSHMLQIQKEPSAELKISPSRQIRCSEDIQHVERTQNTVETTTKVKRKINYLELANFIEKFSVEQQADVCPELIQMGRAFDGWDVKEVTAPQLPSVKQYYKFQPKRKQKTEVLKKVQKQQKNETIQILLGKNYSLEYHQMRREIIDRALNNKLMEQNTRLTQLQKIGNEINYILNRMTEEYFDDFLQELLPYAQDEIYSIVLSDKIIEKVMEEHNFIDIYCKLVKKLKRVNVLMMGGEKKLKFKTIFVERLQQNFYNEVRKGQWEEKEETRKKQLIGLSSFVGELLNLRYLSKFIFSDCFYELIRSYIVQYQKYKDNKSFFYYETYIECAIKIIQKMGSYYDELLAKKNNENTQIIVDELINSVDKEEANFGHICDYIEVLKVLNQRLPSNRFKITFLLEDFRCSKHLKKEKENLNNNEYEIMKDILAINVSNQEQVKNIPKMLEKGNKQILMKDYLFQFAEGTGKEVNNNIQIFKIMSTCQGICDAMLAAFKANLQGISLIESDFPFMGEGLAKIMKTICESKQLNYQQLCLGEYDHQDEDIRWFLQSVEGKYYKMIMQD